MASHWAQPKSGGNFFFVCQCHSPHPISHTSQIDRKRSESGYQVQEVIPILPHLVRREEERGGGVPRNWGKGWVRVSTQEVEVNFCWSICPPSPPHPAEERGDGSVVCERGDSCAPPPRIPEEGEMLVWAVFRLPTCFLYEMYRNTVSTAPPGHLHVTFRVGTSSQEPQTYSETLHHFPQPITDLRGDDF